MSCRRSLLLSATLLLTASACGKSASPDRDKHRASPDKPGEPDEGGCQLILRSVDGIEDGALRGTFDVDETLTLSRVAQGFVRFRIDGQALGAGVGFEDVNATRTDGGIQGYQRFSFSIPVTGDPQVVELVPGVELENRLVFEHNRFKNADYIARAADGFRLTFNDGVCPAKTDCEVPGVDLVRAYPNLSLRDVTSIHWEPRGVNGQPPRVFAVEKLGRIIAWPDRDDVTDADVTVFLDWRNNEKGFDPTRTYVRGSSFGPNSQQGWEEGMLDVAFDPEWPEVPEVYVTYNTGIGDPEAGGHAEWNLSRWSARRNADGSVDATTLDPASRKLLIQVPKKALTHNGGRVLFHPVDRTLFVSVGTDGGFPFDLHGHAQNPNILFGSIIRIDVRPDRRDEEKGYSIPADNPFAVPSPARGGTLGFRQNGQGARPEIWTLGNRNPWKMNFDSEAPHELWGAEVGENAQEEVNVYEAGGNYGYPFLEGDFCTFRGIDAGRCNNFGFKADNLVAPEFVLYASGNQARPPEALTGDSITGGYVYRGKENQNLEGWYVFADFLSGQIMAYKNGLTTQPVVISESGKPISTFGENPERELYVVGHFHQEQTGATSNGEIYRVRAASCQKKRPGLDAKYVFLAADGAGTDETARIYYQSILPGRDIDTYSFAQFKQEFFTDDSGQPMETIKQIYKNDWDLAFWRDMECTTEISAGKGGCCVTNWTSEDRVPPDLGTVCMTVAPKDEDGPYTRFFVFGPDEKRGGFEDANRILQTFAILDDEDGDGTAQNGVLDEDDKKYVPQLCTPCHGGIRYRTGGSPNIGSIFREFEPALLEPPTTDPNHPEFISEDDLQEKFRQFNLIALGANKALENDTPMVHYLEQELYAPGDINVPGTKARSIFDEEPPPSWTVGDLRANPESKVALWKDAVNAFCMGCHRIRKVEVNFNEYKRFHGMGVPSLNAQAQVRVPIRDFTEGDYRNPDPAHPPFMPHTQNMYDRMTNPNDPRGRAARDAIENWLVDMGVPERRKDCRIKFVTKNGPRTIFGDNAFLLGQTALPDAGLEDPLGAWQVADAVAMSTNQLTFPSWEATISVPQGLAVEFKVVTKTQKGEVLFEEPAFINHVIDIPNRDGTCIGTVEFEFGQPGTEVVTFE